MKKLIPILIIVILTALSCNKSGDMLTPAEQLDIDIEKIEEFLELNDIEAQRTLSGSFRSS